jgi:hypothetical protein
MMTKQLARRQARWAFFFAEFDFILTHRPGSRKGKADFLSRRGDYVGVQLPSPFGRKALCTALGSKARLSTFFHPQTDGQSERVNQILIKYLRCCLNYNPDNSVDLLPLAEFAYNNTVNSSTGVTPFFANYGHHPRYDLFNLPLESSFGISDVKENMDRIMLDLQSALHRSQERYKRASDAHRSQTPELPAGTLVWLLSKHIRSSRP